MKAASSELLRAAHSTARVASDAMPLELRSLGKSSLGGEMLGKGHGSSLDFHEHRPYSPGDDPRHIDWRAYARSEQYSLKLFREEIAPRVDLLFDYTASMFLDDKKSMRCFELLYFVLESALSIQASVRCQFLNGGTCTPVDVSRILAYQLAEPLAQDSPVSLSQSLRTAQLRASSCRVIISDLLYPELPESALTELSKQNGYLLFLAPYSEEEARPSWSGSIEFIDCESGAHRDQSVNEELLERYLAAYQAHFLLWRDTALKYRANIARVSASSSLIASLEKDALPKGIVRPWA